MTTMERVIPYTEVNTEVVREGFRFAFPGRKTYERRQLIDGECIGTEGLLVWGEYRDW